jgi:hypothetical protein
MEIVLDYEGIGEHYGNSYPIINPQASKYRFIFKTVEICRSFEI